LYKLEELFDLKTQIDESDNPFIRVTRSVTDKFSSVFGGMFKSTEMSEVLTEIVKVEPSFEINAFLRRVQFDIIPNIMESVNQGELEILKDWCTEVAYTVLSHSLTQCQQLKLRYHNEILDVRDIDVNIRFFKLITKTSILSFLKKSR
jgi:import inner membrane translocase subunit TIM44